MTAALYAFTCGHLTMPLGAFLEGEDGMLTVPVPAFLAVHEKGAVLFDTGLSPHLADGDGAYRSQIHASIETHVSAPDLIGARLAAAGIDSRRITHVVNSHLHFDHAGGNCLAPDVPVLVQAREVAAARKGGARFGYVTQDFETGQTLQTLDGAHDVFGDGAVVCLPTYGHTPGHQSLKVAADGGTFVLAGDACYLRRTLEEMHLPASRYDAVQMRASLARLKALQARGATIVYGHDPAFWAGVPQAPLRLA